MIPKEFTGIEVTESLNCFLNGAPGFLEYLMLLASSPVFYLFIPLSIAAYILWFVDRRFGEFLITSIVLSVAMKDVIKLLVAQPRPWILDESITPSEKAVSGASGYSFPSGHAATATAGYLGLATRMAKPVAVACIIATALICLSRILLGVHTPLDVIGGILLSVAILAVNRWALERSHRSGNRATYSVALLVVSAVASIIVMSNADASDNALLSVGLLLGTAAGMPLADRFGVGSIRCEQKMGCMMTAAGLAATGMIALASVSMPWGWISVAGGFACGIWIVLVFPMVCGRALTASS